MGRFIEIESWKRKEHFNHFRGMAQPFFSVCIEVDVTSLRESCRETGRSFFLASLYRLVRAANETEPMRLRIRDGGVWLHDSVGVSSTILRPDETFGLARVEPTENEAEFERVGAERIDQARNGPPLFADSDDAVIYHSTLPWIRFTAFSNALPLGSDSIPRIVFGKCALDASAWKMPVAVEVHHALMDGIDVARFLERFEAFLAG